MKIVIEIQDYVYRDIQTYKTIFSNKIEEVAKAIKYGTPLPKGHGRLIDADEVKKRFPIMENDFGMVINETLHKELDKVPTVEAISKVDMMAILDKIKAEIEEEYGNCDICEWYEDYDYEENDISEYQRVGNVSDILAIIDKYKAESEE